MKRKLSLLLVVTLLCTLFVMPVSAAEASDYSDDEISVAATSGSNYFSKITPMLNSLNGSAAMASLSSGSCSGNERSITSVSVYCRVSSGSSRYTLYVISPEGTTLSQSCGTSSTTYNFTGFNGEDPKGNWTIMVVSNGVVTTVTSTLKVNYNYSF
ncbi:MAG: hypothetical protein HFH50_16300 [Lachnospiraceae bacterium]|jgi:hypothetical protein|nr:hypothetical protein [Lachnospiraceae bacterium]GFI29223.1 hypothetical protein IMSAGC013_00607 [Lachnospiraceae bacterium]